MVEILHFAIISQIKTKYGQNQEKTKIKLLKLALNKIIENQI